MREEIKTYYNSGKIYHKYDIFDEDKDDYVLTFHDEKDSSIIILAVYKNGKFHGVKSKYKNKVPISKKTYKSISEFNMGFENGIQIELTYA